MDLFDILEKAGIDDEFEFSSPEPHFRREQTRRVKDFCNEGKIFTPYIFQPWDTPFGDEQNVGRVRGARVLKCDEGARVPQLADRDQEAEPGKDQTHNEAAQPRARQVQ